MSIIFSLATLTVHGLGNCANPYSMYQPPLWVKMQLTISLPAPKNKPQCSVNCGCTGPVYHTAMNSSASFRNAGRNSQSLQYVFVYNITYMHAISRRFDFFLAHNSRVNIWEAELYYPITDLFTVSEVDLDCSQISSYMSDYDSLITSLLEVLISSQHECVFIRDFSNLTLQIIFNSWWLFMSVGSKCPVTSNNPRHVLSWRLNLHCGKKETGIPGIMCIISHQVLHY